MKRSSVVIKCKYTSLNYKYIESYNGKPLENSNESLKMIEDKLNVAKTDYAKTKFENK